MSQSAAASEHAIVLSTTQLREADLIASLLCERSGRISAVFRGARRSKKRFMGGVDLFDCAVFELHPPRGRSDLYTAGGISKRTLLPSLRANLSKFSCAAFCLEIASALTVEGDPDSSLLFPPLHSCLTALDKAPSGLEHPLAEALRFTLTAMERAGFDPASRFAAADKEVLDWWKSLVEEHSHTAAPEQSVLAASVHTLISFTEEIREKPLKTKEGLLHCLRSYAEL